MHPKMLLTFRQEMENLVALLKPVPAANETVLCEIGQESALQQTTNI